MRALMIGGIVALVVVAIAAAAVLTGALSLASTPQAPQRLLLIATAPDDEGTEIARFAFVLERGADTAILLDTGREATVEGTTARTPAEAYPFGGSTAVVKALAEQTSGEVDAWIAVPASEWSALVDAAGGVEVGVPSGLSVYRDGRLTVLEAGKRRVAGEGLVALASALDYVQPQDERRKLYEQMNASLSAVIAADLQRLPSLVTFGEAESSLSEDELTAFSAKP